jgi:UTP--glucose-1-phosphate uridylyltransferase
MTKKITKAVFPVAGLATRFLPATKVVPKELLPLVDKPVLQYAVEEAAEAGITDFIFVTSKRKPTIETHFRPSLHLSDRIANDCNIDPERLHIVYQDDPLGLGHAVLCARNSVGDDDFAVLLPDDLILHKPGALRQMVDYYNTHDVSALIAAAVARSSDWASLSAAAAALSAAACALWFASLALATVEARMPLASLLIRSSASFRSLATVLRSPPSVVTVSESPP